MNWEQIKKNVGYRVQLVPVACRLDKNNRELPRTDDDWIIEAVADTGVAISNTQHTNLSITLGKDHIHHFTTNPNRAEGGEKFGFLTLNVQVFSKNGKSFVRPNTRPGDSVKPHLDKITEKRSKKWIAFIIAEALILMFVLLVLKGRIWPHPDKLASNQSDQQPPTPGVKPEAVTSSVPLGAPLVSKLERSHPPKTSETDNTSKTDLGVHSTNETVTMPPKSKATFAYGKLQPGDLETLDKMEKEQIAAKDHLEHYPDKLVLHDLFLTDFTSLNNSSSLRSGMTTKNGTGASTHVEYIIVRQLETGTKFLEFYIQYSNETEGICKSLADLYQNALNDFLEGRVEAEKIPGDSEVTTSSDLVFSNRIFIYHETYLSPEQVIAVRDTFKKKGVTVILRSTDYLSNRQLDAKVKLLEKKH